MPVQTVEIYPLGIDCKKIFCAYHRTQFLTNFCEQKQCLMPLCPSCIAEHTQEHFLEGKKPTYSNINETLNRAKQSCYCTIITLQEYRKLNLDLCEYITSLQQSIHGQLTSLQSQLFEIITSKFNEYEQRLIKQINQNYKQKNVYLIQESINASKFIDEEISNLYEKISLLKGDECLSALITYYAVDQLNYKESLIQFDQYFEKNRKAGKIQISIINEALQKFTNNICDQLLSVECVIQNFQHQPYQPQDLSQKSKRYGFNKQSQRPLLQNQSISNLKRQSFVNSRRSKEQIGIISRQQKDLGFSGRTFPNSKLHVPVTQINKDFLANDNINKRQSIAENLEETELESKRLVRGYKKEG